MTQPAFIHLRLHSEYSVTDGIVRIDDAVRRAQAQRMPALALTDLMNLFGMVKHYKACRSAGIKPIVGADVWIENPEDRDKPFRALLLAKNRAGYGRLCELLTAAFRHNQYRGRAEIKPDWLAQGDNSALIALSGAHLGEVGQLLLNGNLEAARLRARWWADCFRDSFYLELQRTGDPRAETQVHGAIDLAAELDLPVVATHPVQFLDRDDFKAHEARVCIAEGYVMADKRRPRLYTPEQYFKSPEEMAALFADVPEALANSVAIAQRCNITVQLGKNYLPLFPTPDGLSLDDYLVLQAREGLEKRLPLLFPDPAQLAARREEYESRLKFETDTIIQMGFPGYFLIVADFINWAKNNGCPVGPGRGSGAGSLVAYSLGITDIDPLRYALLFERFLNPERVSMPDFDIDFCQDNRWRVIEYVRQKYGDEAVSQIATFGTLASKAVVRDVGRVLDLPYNFCDQLSKLIPAAPGKQFSLDDAVEMEPQLKERIANEEEVAELWALGKKLEGMTRNIGMHAGGVLIAPGKLTDFCPLYQASGEDASPVSQYDKDDVEQIGLVKFDFLGLRNLTILEMACQYIERLGGGKVDLATLALDDQQAYKIFQDGNTTAVFQFESSGMKDMLKRAKPDRFEEIIAFVALYRPGPMDLIPDFIARKQGQAFEYLHPLLEPVLAPTYGIMVYQEQVMQAAQVCGGYSLGGADLLRRAMGKKKPEEMVKQRAIFVEGAATKQISEAKANEIFDYMEKFAGYGFNKSHAAAYALISYHTAWLKAHHCAAYMAATMSTELNDTDQLKVFYDDAVANGIKILPPDVNASFYRFVPVSRREIRYGLGAIKGTGEAAIDHIVAVREQGGPFRDLFDFCQRTDKKLVNRRVIEALIRGGAFDQLSDHRAALIASVGLALEAAEQAAVNASQGSLFDLLEAAPEHQLQLVEVPRWDEATKLIEEKSAIGFYLSGHPFDAQARAVRGFVKTPLARLAPRKEPQWLAGVVTELRTKIGQRGKMAFITLDDASARREVSVFSEAFEVNRAKLREDTLLIIEGKVSEDSYSGGLRIIADKIYDLAEARSRFAQALSVGINGQADAGRLRQLLDPYLGGDCPIEVLYRNREAQCGLKLGEGWRVTLRDELLTALRGWLGDESVSIRF
ncbi:DNA polymerase III subunit alpha [Chitinimonas lacunae]|uniref:DNA polymerase III subunit alpha n=1 Tax=Chitinimonas lacunae TaxID=1963018 RepID=A0ABV8MKD1_9NEIS